MTPTLRDSEDSAPYCENGSKLTLSDVVPFYIDRPQLAPGGLPRNPPLEYENMSTRAADSTTTRSSHVRGAGNRYRR